MARNFNELQAKMSPERRVRIAARVREAISQMALDELREARKLTQAQLAKTLEVDQGSVSKLERRTDMYVSTLRNFIRAMGGELHIRADFPDGSVEISQFESNESEVQGNSPRKSVAHEGITSPKARSKQASTHRHS
jgi:transcriptional regulator with XRE-family HTH domain